MGHAESTRNQPEMGLQDREFPPDSFGAYLKCHRTVWHTGKPVGSTWTQVSLAIEVGVSVETISNWERNKVCPENVHFRGLLSAFGLLDAEGKPTNVDHVNEFERLYQTLKIELSEKKKHRYLGKKRETRLSGSENKSESTHDGLQSGLIPSSVLERHKDLLRARLQYDFSRSSLHNQELLEPEHKRSQRELEAFHLTRRSQRRLSPLFEKLEHDSTFLGIHRSQSKADLKDLSDSLGRKIRIACPAVIAGASAVSKALAREYDISVIEDAATSSEQATSLRKNAGYDFVVAADGPMFTDVNESLELYCRAMPICRMTNIAFEKIGAYKGSGNRSPTMYFYNGSASVLHLAVSKKSEFGVELPSYRRQDLSLPALMDSPSSLLMPKDLVLVWSPIDEVFMRDPTLNMLEKSRYDFTMSLFYNVEISNYIKGIIAFMDLWVGTWTRLRLNIKEAERLLSDDAGFLESLYAGNGGVYLDSILKHKIRSG